MLFNSDQFGPDKCSILLLHFMVEALKTPHTHLMIPTVFRDLAVIFVYIAA
jgi:hypothetical protein